MLDMDGFGGGGGVGGAPNAENLRELGNVSSGFKSRFFFFLPFSLRVSFFVFFDSAWSCRSGVV